MEQPHANTKKITSEIRGLQDIFYVETINLINRYVDQPTKTFSKMLPEAQKEIANFINIRAWYLLWFLYNQHDSRNSTPMIITTGKYKEHLLLTE